MAAWATSRIFANLTGNAHNICRRTVFSCFRGITGSDFAATCSHRHIIFLEMSTRRLMQPARSSGVIFNQVGVRAASNGKCSG